MTMKMTEKTSNFRAEVSQIIGEGYYGYQQMRIQTMNRIRNLIHRRWQGLTLSEVQKKKPEDEKYMEEFQDKNIPEYIRILNEHGRLSDRERDYVSKAYEAQKRAKAQERDYQGLMREFIEDEPIYKEFLEKIKGISQVLSTNLIKEFGYCENAPHVSSLWAYCGLHVVCPDCVQEKEGDDGKKQKYHLPCGYNGYCEICGKKGIAESRRAGVKNNFSIHLRSMVWNIGDSFVKQRTPYYREIYDQEKERQNSKPPEKINIDNAKRIKGDILGEKVGKFKKGTKVTKDNYPKIKETAKQENKDSILIDMCPGHINNRALRKMVKRFLSHYWECAKDLTNQEKSEPYVKDKKGHKHISGWKEAVEAQLKKKADDTVKK